MSDLFPAQAIVLPLWPEWALEVVSGRKVAEFRRRTFLSSG